jgi:hypothetical protein
MRRPVVTLTVQSSDASFFVHQLVCHIDTGCDPSLVLRSYQTARDLGLAVSDRSVFIDDAEGEAELADGTVVQYFVEFLFIPQWVDGRPRWAKVLIPPPETGGSDRTARSAATDAPGYIRPDALLGLDLLRWAVFRLNESQAIVELLPLA